MRAMVAVVGAAVGRVRPLDSDVAFPIHEPSEICEINRFCVAQFRFPELSV